MCPRCKQEHESRWKMCDSCRAKQRTYLAKYHAGEPTTTLCLYCNERLPKKRRVVCLSPTCLQAAARAKGERAKGRNKARYASDPAFREKVLARNATWSDANRETKRDGYRRAYAVSEDRRQSVKESARRRRAIKAASRVAIFSSEQLHQRLSMYRGCWICGSPEWEHVDHVKPLSRGGAHILANLRPACAGCNLSKGSKWPFDPRH